jgi:hypothetical protein
MKKGKRRRMNEIVGKKERNEEDSKELRRER